LGCPKFPIFPQHGIKNSRTFVLLIKSSNGSFRGNRHCYFVQFLNKYKGMTKKWIVKVTIGIIVTVGAYACQKDGTSISSPLSNVWSLVSSDAPLMEMTYETEITTYQKVLVDRASAEHKFFDLVAAQPTVKRQAVVFRLKNDGATYIETTDMESLHPVPTPAHLSSPDNRPKVHKTIMDGTSMRIYAANGNLIKESTLQSALKNTQVVESIQNMKSKASANDMANSISTMQLSRMFGLNIADMEQQANANGGSVIMEGAIKLIRIPYPNPSNENQKFIVITVDTNKNVPLFMDITNAQGKASVTTSYYYQNMNEVYPVLKEIRTASYGVSATGSDIVRYMTMTLSNVNATIH
jgi:hypothetical protein